jgi:cytochrome o ubiquinol oxidase subunit III
MSQAAAGTIDHHHDPSTSTGIPNKKLMMWAFLASDCMFFGSLISTHLIYRLNPIEGNPSPVDLFDIELTSFSTFILLMSSLMMALAVAAIQKGQLVSMRRCLLTTVFFGLIFLGCQVYEFQHFVYEKGLTLSSSMFGSTFYVLTGTHGVHVAIGVLWLCLMYVRSFKRPENPNWLSNQFLHGATLAASLVLTLVVSMGFIHAMEGDAAFGAALGEFFAHQWLPLILLAGALVALRLFARPRGAVEFGQGNAIDVEGAGLYWHFVDIVWIIIFTAVYLIEYI